MENFKVYWNDELVAKVDIRPNKVFVDRYTRHPLKQIFPKDEISRYEFGRILAARCWEEKRSDIALILKKLELKEYNIYEIMRKTHGVSYNDSIWFEFDGEELSSDQVLIKKDRSFYRYFDAAMKVDIDGTSEGTQSKYYSGGYWYKTDSCGGEAYSECLASLLLESSNLEEAPIFDNGKSLFVGNYSVNRHLPIADNLERVVSKPFFGTHEAVYRYFQDFTNLRVDTSLLCDKIETSNLPDCLQKEVLLVNLHEQKALWK